MHKFINLLKIYKFIKNLKFINLLKIYKFTKHLSKIINLFLKNQKKTKKH